MLKFSTFTIYGGNYEIYLPENSDKGCYYFLCNLLETSPSVSFYRVSKNNHTQKQVEYIPNEIFSKWYE